MTEAQEHFADNQALIQALKVNDGWGSLLDEGTLQPQDAREFVDFLNLGLLAGEESEKLSFIDEAGVPTTVLRDDLLCLGAEELADAHIRFRFVQTFLDDSSKIGFWSKKILAIKEAFSAERLAQLLEGDRQIKAEITENGLETSALSALFLGAIVNSFDAETGRSESLFLDSLMKEFLVRDFFALEIADSKSEREMMVVPAGDILRTSRGIGGKVEPGQWTCSSQDGRILVYPFKAKDPKGDKSNIGRCCFTVESLTLGLESEKRQRGFRRSVAGASLDSAFLARIVYNRYEDPRLSGAASFLVSEQSVKSNGSTLVLSKIQL